MFYYQSKDIPLYFKISLFEAKVVGFTAFCTVFVGKVAEFKAFIQELGSGNFGFAGMIQLSQYPSVLFKDVRNVGHKFRNCPVAGVVKRSTALIGTKTLVDSTLEIYAAI